MGKPNFSDEFKRDAVAQITERGYTVAEVSQRLTALAVSPDLRFTPSDIDGPPRPASGCDPSPVPSMVPDAVGSTRTEAENYIRKSAANSCLPDAIGRPQTRKWRPEPESNRRKRICSPVRNHSAIGPRCASAWNGAVSRASPDPQRDSCALPLRDRRNRRRASPFRPSPPRSGCANTSVHAARRSRP